MSDPLFILFTDKNDRKRTPNIQSCFDREWNNFSKEKPVFLVNATNLNAEPDDWDIAVVWESQNQDYEPDVEERIRKTLMEELCSGRPVAIALHQGSGPRHAQQESLIKNLISSKNLIPQNYEKKPYSHSGKNEIYLAVTQAIRASNTNQYRSALQKLSSCFFFSAAYSSAIEVFIPFLPIYIKMQCDKKFEQMPPQELDSIRNKYKDFIQASKILKPQINIDENNDSLECLIKLLEVDHNPEDFGKVYLSLRDHLTGIIQKLEQ